MATLAVTYGAAMGAGVPVYASIPRASEAITTSASSQATTATARSGDFASCTASGGAVWISIGQSPTAAAGTHYLIPDGATKDFGPLLEGDKVAVIDA